MNIKTKSELKNLINNANRVEAEVVRNKGRLVINMVANRIDEKYLELKSNRMDVLHSTDTLTNLLTDHINDGYVKEIIVDDKKIIFGGN